MNGKNTAHTLQTDRLPADIADIARGMADAGHTEFSTGIYSAYGALHWIEAWKNPQTGLWAVERHKYVAAGNQHPKETIMRGACLFDAVDICARFEQSQNIAENPEIESFEGMPKKKTHFREAAEAACIPFDQDDLPHPAAFGRILTDGDFDTHAHDVAAKTAGKKVQAVRADAQVRSLSRELVTLKPDASSYSLLSVDGKMKMHSADLMAQNNLRDAFDVAKEVDYKLNKLIVEKFPRDKIFSTLGPVDENSPFPMVAVVFSAGIYYPVHCGFRRWLGGNGMLRRNFYIQKARLDSCVKKLPDGQEKTFLEQFSKAAATAVKLEEAAMIYKQCSRGEKKPSWLKKGLNLIERGCRENNMQREEIEKMKNAYLSGDFPAPRYFYEKLTAQLREALPARLSPAAAISGP